MFSEPTKPRAGWEVRRRERLLAGLDLHHGRWIEVGPLASPLIRKDEGNVVYVDHVNRADLVAKYGRDPGVDVRAIVEVDLVCGERPLTECFPDREHGHFEGAVASHVIEHVPDLIGWLRSIAALLRQGGLLLLAIPDRRYSFDHFRRATVTAEVVDAFLRESRRPTPGQVFDQVAFETQLDALTAWLAPAPPDRPSGRPSASHALRRAREAAAAYTDVHCWVFTPASLLAILASLVEMGLLPFRCAAFEDTRPFESEMLLRLEKVDIADPAAMAEAQRSFTSAGARLSPPRAGKPTPIVPPPRRRLKHLLSPARRRQARPAFAEEARLRAEGAAFPFPEHLGSAFPPYQALFVAPGLFVDPGQAELAAMPVEGGLLKAETPGFLRPADALLLYELAWHAVGDVLELGSAWGLSATVLCRAVCNARRGASVVSVEIDPAFQRLTVEAVSAAGLRDHFDPQPGPAQAVMRRLNAERRTFSVAFVDHDHGAAAVADAAHQLATLLRPGGIAAFHDFNDERNVSEPDTYGVYPAVANMVRQPEWRYLGVLGCCALVQRTTS